MSSDTPALLHAVGSSFETPDGQAVYLAGVHTWTNGQQIGATPLDYGAYLGLLNSEHANLVRLWTWHAGVDGGDAYGPVAALPWVKTAGGQYDLTRFNQSYFDTLLSEVRQAGANGDYVSVMLFQGWSVNAHGSANNPWSSNPFNAANNVNGIDGDPAHTGRGDFSMTLADPAILRAQEAYVAKVIQTVGHESNVLFEVANEAPDTSPAAMAWQNAIVDFIHSYEASNGYLSHLAGITGTWSQQGLSSSQINAILHGTHADWISPTENGYWDTSTPAAGDKPVIVDTDHVYGIGGSAGWVWKQFTDGNSVLSMDNLDGTGIAGTLPGVNLSSNLIASEVSTRLGITETREAANLVGMTGMKPSGSLSSTGFALADPSSGRYIIYAPSGGTITADLSGSAGRILAARWLDLGSDQLSGVTDVQAATSQQTFTAPGGAAALILTPEVGGATAPSTPSAPPSSGSGPSPQGVTSGSGSDTLTVNLAEDAYLGDAQATISIDGTLLTPTPLTVTASQSAGATDSFSFKGGFGVGDHQVVVTLLNDAGTGPGQDRNLYVDGVSLDGNAATSGTARYAWGTYDVPMPVPVYGSNDTATFALHGGSGASASPSPVTSSAAANSPATSNQSTLTVTLAEDAYEGDAQVTISIDGTVLTPTPVTVAALRSGGASDTLTFQGDFGSGPHKVAVGFANDAYGGAPDLDRNLYVEGVSLNGTAVQDGIAHYESGDYSMAHTIELYGANDTATYLVSAS